MLAMKKFILKETLLVFIRLQCYSEIYFSKHPQLLHGKE